MQQVDRPDTSLTEDRRYRLLVEAVILATGYAELPADADPATPRLDKPFSQQALAGAIARCMSVDRTADGR